MKAHPYDPDRLARELHEQHMKDVSPDEILGDMRANPDLYFPDHADACQRGGTLPLSSLAWRRACRVA